MKRVSYIFLMGLTFSLLLSIIYVHVKATPDFEPHEKKIISSDLKYSLPLLPTDINTLNTFFPFNKEMVCRKPEDLHTRIKSLGKYQFERFIISKEMPLNKSWKRVEGNDIYKNGNATLLIPQSFTVHNRSGFYPDQPAIIFPGKN